MSLRALTWQPQPLLVLLQLKARRDTDASRSGTWLEETVMIGGALLGRWFTPPSHLGSQPLAKAVDCLGLACSPYLCTMEDESVGAGGQP